MFNVQQFYTVLWYVLYILDVCYKNVGVKASLIAAAFHDFGQFVNVLWYMSSCPAYMPPILQP